MGADRCLYRMSRDATSPIAQQAYYHPSFHDQSSFWPVQARRRCRFFLSSVAFGCNMPVQASKGSDSETESNEQFPMLNHAAPEVQKIEIVPVAPQEADLDEFEEEEETVEESEVEQAEDAQAAAIEEHAEMPADADMRTAEETDEETPEYREIPIESYEQKGTSEKPIRINSADGQATVPGTSEFAEEEDMSESSSNDLDLPTGIATETASEHERARGRRRVIFVRNAESIENVFPDWIRRGFVTVSCLGFGGSSVRNNFYGFFRESTGLTIRIYH